MDKLENTYRAILAESLSVEASTFDSGDYEFEQSERWDSLLQMDIVSKLESELGIFFDNNDILDFVSYQKGLEILKKLCAAK